MKLFRLLRNKQGFTLIELLIVIALLGALAVGLIGALDPFEQLKKGTDTGTRDLVNQVQTAVIRFYSIKNNMPWCPDGAGATCLADPAGGDLTTAPMPAAILSMIAAGEFKAEFNELNAGKLDEVFVTGSQLNNEVAACYRPTSKSFRADPNTKYDINAVEVVNPGTECEGNGGAVVCYWCIK